MIHAAAKFAIVQVVQDWKTGRGSRPLIVQHCSICGLPCHRPIPAVIVNAVAEVPHVCRFVRDSDEELRLQGFDPDGDLGGSPIEVNIRFDVGLLGESGLLAGVEVFQQHEVERPDILWLKVPWLEVTASEILEDPLHWRPRRHELAEIACGDCARQVPLFEAKRAEVAAQCQTELPPQWNDVVSSFFRCRACGKLTIVHCWENANLQLSCDLPGNLELANVWVSTWPDSADGIPHRAEHNHCYHCRACIAWQWLFGSVFAGIATDNTPFELAGSDYRLANNALCERLIDAAPRPVGPSWTGIQRIQPIWEAYV